MIELLNNKITELVGESIDAALSGLLYEILQKTVRFQVEKLVKIISLQSALADRLWAK